MQKIVSKYYVKQLIAVAVAASKAKASFLNQETNTHNNL